MKAALLTIGDEILIGQILNSNTQWMSEKLTDLGVSVNAQLTVGDREEEIHEALHFLTRKADALIIGGGLGPTHDDLTMEALSSYFKTPLVYDAEWVSRIEAFFKSRNRVMSENNKKQGYLLKDAIRIDNDCGTAAGQHFRIGALDIFVVPGVPHEMKSMMDRYILPFLSRKDPGTRILKRSLLTTGAGESQLAEQIASFVNKVKTLPQLTLAFLPSNTVVKLRLQMQAKSPVDEREFEQLAAELQEACGNHFFGFEPDTLEQYLVRTLTERNETISLAESCTGGLISHRLTQVPGSSIVLKGGLIPYQTEIKNLELGIDPLMIEEKGIVSEPVAIAMAESIRKKWNSTYGLATTGYLGEGSGDALAPAGTVCFALSTERGTEARTFRFELNRERSKERASQVALDLLRRTFR